MASSGIRIGHKVASFSRHRQPSGWTTSKPSASVTDDGLGATGSWSRDVSQVNAAESVPGNDALKAEAAAHHIGWNLRQNPDGEVLIKLLRPNLKTAASWSFRTPTSEISRLR